ncbi:hypothetical protein GCM10023144_45490 [Pigmentiphaga soli]|uniref:Uncharacterized protein n=1 Tax=Pigmentiphaga soli TaxID=1007095 RepID=A0ABP8HR36_9BURK
MSRQLADAAEIRRAVQEAVDALPEIKVDGERVEVWEPRRHAPDDQGCNWSIDGYDGPDVYEPLVAECTALVRARYNLRD